MNFQKQVLDATHEEVCVNGFGCQLLLFVSGSSRLFAPAAEIQEDLVPVQGHQKR